MLIFLIVQCTAPKTIYKYENKITGLKEMNFIEISFINMEDNIELSGTLIVPAAEYKTILMIVPGSGKDTRHSHFKLAENLLKNNIAVFRFDERGVGKSKGKYNYTATSLTKDVFYAFQTLKENKELSNKKIGILGHSLGGIASIAVLGKGCEIDFLVQMACPVENKGAFIKYQALTNTRGFYSVKNKTTKQVINFIDSLIKLVDDNKEEFHSIEKRAKLLMDTMNFKGGKHIVNPLIIDLIKQNHQSTYKNSIIPILYIIGTEDKIVSCKNESLVLEKLDNPNIKIVAIENVNHWLNEKLKPTKMDISLYDINEEASNIIVEWVKKF